MLLLSNPLCEAVVKSCLTRAQFLHPVTLCHFLVESTHVHMVLVVDNPHDVQGFIGRFKTESAHLLNRLLGRKKRTVWCDGYDSPVVLTPTRAMACITYLYANPAKDNLEDSIDAYPGLSSWQMYQKRSHTRNWKYFRRPAVKALARDSHNLRGYTKEAKSILEGTKKTFAFTIKPNAWMEAFGIVDPAEQEKMNQRILTFIRHREERARKQRKRDKKGVIGADRLVAQPLDRYYEPKRSGRRMWCLADKKSIRVSFIATLKRLIDKARQVYRKWFLGDFSEPYPLGLYPPGMPKLAEPLSAW